VGIFERPLVAITTVNERRKMTEQKPRVPFDFFQSPWWKDMNEQLCVDGWPQLVVCLNSFVNEAKQDYEAVVADRYESHARNIQLYQINQRLVEALVRIETEDNGWAGFEAAKALAEIRSLGNE